MRALALLLPVLATACGEADRRAETAGGLTPQPIGYPDIEKNGLIGASCAFASGSSMAPLVIAFADEAVLKIDGRIQRFAVDAESPSAEGGTRTRYLAEGRTLLLSIKGGGGQEGRQTGNFSGRVRLVDSAGAELFATEGGVQCGS